MSWKTLCNNRILATMAMTILRYDINACYGLKLPTSHRTFIDFGVLEPDTGIEVKIILRPCYERGG